MASKESRRVMSLRNKNYERVDFLAPKGTKILLRVMGRKERCSSADVIRRAIMARAGLERLPDEELLAKIDETTTRKEAAAALIHCQTVEHGQKRLGMPWYPSQSMTKEEIIIMEKIIIPALQQQKPFELPATIKVSRNLYTAMSRLLSRMECDDDM